MIAMCLGIPGEVVELDPERDDLAVVAVNGVRRVVNVGLIDDAPLAAGDWVLIHVRFAMSRISEAQAAEQLRLLSMLGEADEAMEEVRGYRFGGETIGKEG